jgi:hypothetical protein
LHTKPFSEDDRRGQLNKQAPGVRQLAPRTCALNAVRRTSSSSSRQQRHHSGLLTVNIIIINSNSSIAIISFVVITLQGLCFSMSSFA